MIVDGIKYKGTSGFYELIFKRIPDDTIYTEIDKLAYKGILLATNVHRRSHKANNPIVGSKRYKYKNIIPPLVSGKIHVGHTTTGIPRARKLNNKLGKRVGKDVIPCIMTLKNNKMDYVH